MTPQHERSERSTNLLETTLSVRDLVIEVPGPTAPLRAVNGVSFDIRADEVLGIVGESGSGKSLTMLAVMGLLPRGVRVSSGSILFRGTDILRISSKDRRALLGRDIAIIFQDPMSSLNPVMRIGRQIAEMVRSHDKTLSGSNLHSRVIELLQMVRIPDAEARYAAYPHEMSGGMRQRVMIAMAMAHNPALLIADEPTTALDVTIQAQILRMLRRLQEETGASMGLITHDLGVIAEAADQVVVMYGGRIVETGPVARVFAEPRHPYTVGLLASALRLDGSVDEALGIPGQPPPIGARPSGCVFRPRCGLRDGRDRCAAVVPALVGVGERSEVACHYHSETRAWAASSAAPRGSVQQDRKVPLS